MRRTEKWKLFCNSDREIERFGHEKIAFRSRGRFYYGTIYMIKSQKNKFIINDLKYTKYIHRAKIYDPLKITEPILEQLES